jgi:pyroglutamyl-peptidase
VTAAPSRHILVTGFDPFDGDAVNPSGEVAKRLDGRVIGDRVVRSAMLPVQLGVVHLGLAGGRARISLERVAVNVMDYSRPDAHGQVLCDVACAHDGPAGYFSTLPLREMLAALTAEGIPAAISNTAGTYLCNHVLYATLHHLAARELSRPAGFIHLPFLPSMVAAHDRDEPSMDLSTMIRAVEVVLPLVGAH